MSSSKIKFLSKIKSFANSIVISENVFKKEVNNKNFVFVQIGANDGVSQDPINAYNKNWKGYFIEPLEDPFERLKENYKDQNNKQYFKLAIGEKNGEIDIFLPKESSDFATKLASIGENSGLLKDMETISVKVEVQTLDTFLDKNNIKNIDLLMIDVEGHELDILEAYSFSVLPKYILMETRFYSFEQIVRFNKKMEDLGYSIFNENDNTFYLKK